MMKYLEGKHSDVGTTWQMAQPKNKQIQIAQSITSQRRRKRKTQMKFPMVFIILFLTSLF